MSRAAIALLASLLAACASVNTRETTMLPTLFVCGHYPYDFEDPPIKPIKIPRVSPVSSAVLSSQPRYPYEARLNRWEGTLSLDLLVEPNGTVRRAKVTQSSGRALLDRCAVAAFRHWRFKPGTADHLQVPVTYSLRCPKIAEEQHRNRIHD
jgi:TonB family protein